MNKEIIKQLKIFAFMIIVGMLLITILNWTNENTTSIKSIGQKVVPSIFKNAGEPFTIVSDLNRNQLQWNGVILNDSTIYNLTDNTCYASRYGFKIITKNCKAQDFDGRDIQHPVSFHSDFTQKRNLTFIFAYDGELESGNVKVLTNRSENVLVKENTWVSNYIIDGVVSSVNLTTKPSYCDLGNSNNTRWYNVTRSRQNGTYIQTICFTQISVVNSSTYSISGNADIDQQETIWKMQYVDVTDKFEYLGKGLLNDNKSYYKIEDVEFTPQQTIDTLWTFTPKNRAKFGKWHILGYETETGLIASIQNDLYLYQDPWWNSTWTKRMQLNVTGGSEILTNFTAFVTIPYDSDMNATFKDLRIVNDSSNNAEEMWFDFDYINTTSAGLWVKFKTMQTGINSIYAYYGNPNANYGNSSQTFSDYRMVLHMNDDYLANVGGNSSAVMANDTSFSYNTLDSPFGLQLSKGTENNYGIRSAQYTILQTTGGTRGALYSFWMKPSPSKSGEDYQSLLLLYAAAAGFWYKPTGGLATDGDELSESGYSPSGTWNIPNITASGSAYTHLNIWMNGTSVVIYSNGQFIIQRQVQNSYTGAIKLLTRGASNQDWFGNLTEFRWMDNAPNAIFTPAYFAREYQNANYSNIVLGAEENPASASLPVNITFNFQNPSDISTINILNQYLNISYNYTNTSTDYWNLSSIRLYTKVNTSISDCEGYFNGSRKCGFNDWGFVSYSGNLSNVFYFKLDDNEIYPAVYNYPDHAYMETENKWDFNISNQNSATRANFINMSNISVYNTLEFNIRNMTSTSAPAQIWYCNSTYVSGSVNTNANCVQLATITNNLVTNHTHGSNSQHYVLPFTITSGRVSNITKVTESSAFIIRGNTGGWNVRYIPNATRTNAAQTATTTFGGSWSELSGTFDMHFHQFSGAESFWYYATGKNSTGTSFNSSERQDLLDLGGLPPSQPIVYNPTATTYSSNISINYTAAVSPNSYFILFYNISLLNSDLSFNRSIATNNSVALGYFWQVNGTNVSNGDYYIKVEAKDSKNQTSSGLSELFTFYTAPPSDYPQYLNNRTRPSSLNPTPWGPEQVYEFNITWIDVGGNNSISVIFNFNGVNYTVSNYTTDKYYKNITGLSVGEYTYYWAANDSGGFYNQTILDIVNVTQVTSTTTITGSNVTYGDTSTYTCSNTVIPATMYINGVNKTTESGVAIVRSGGNYSITCNVTGNSNVSASNAVSAYSVARNNSMGAFSMLPSNNVTYGTTTNVTFVNVSVYLTNNALGYVRYIYNASNYPLTVWFEEEVVGFGNPTFVSDIQTLRGGIYRYRFHLDGNENYTDTTIERNLTINKATPSLSISISPNNIITNGTEISITGSGCPSQLTCELKVNGTIVSNPYIATLPIGIYTINYSASGNENYTSSSTTSTLNVNSIVYAGTNGSITFTPANQSYLLNFTIPYNFATHAFMNLTNVNLTGDYCYQETANASTAIDGDCSLNYSGNYRFINASGIGVGLDALKTIDGNWNTWSSREFGAFSVIYINYSKPSSTIYNATWRIKSNVNSNSIIQDLILPSNCYSQNPVSLKTDNTADFLGSSILNFSCYNGTDWSILESHASSGGSFFEEAILWSVVNYTYVNVSINNKEIYSFTGNSNNINNKTQNFYGQLNSYLGSCLYIGGICYVPINFTSMSVGILNYSAFYVDNSGFIEGTMGYNANSVETKQESFYLNISYDRSAYSITPYLNYNGTRYFASTTNFSLYNATINRTIIVPTGIGNKTFFWEIGLTNSSGTFFYNSTFKNQTISLLNVSLCNYPYTVPFLNFTFHNETLAGEAVTATFTGTINYWLSNQSINKSTTFTSASPQTNYTFCFSPAYSTVYADISATYDNSYSQDRTFTNTSMVLTNSSIVKDLLLLPDTNGIYISFIVQSNYGARISNALIDIKKTSGNVPVEQKYTDGTGIAAFWLSTSTSYTITVTRSGYDTYSTGITPSTSPVTISLTPSSSSGGGGSSSHRESLDISISPQQQILENGTPYDFVYEIIADGISLDEYGFSLWNSTDELVSNQKGTNEDGGTITQAYNTNTQSIIKMKYYYIINGVYTNGTKIWAIQSSDGTDFSIAHAIGTFNEYTSENSTGIFGFKQGKGTGNFSFALIIFFIAFISAGAMTYKFGITSTTATMFVIFSIILFMDVGAGWIPQIGIIPNFITVILGFITALLFVKEMAT